ncbi:YggS family pyridoxal phosphate-dependent enzyme [Sporolactobacillus sp. THM7-7]|nr:YggS family pyridoxal phosphate-dependent enzyme [Sporolactobacillus sp. THM7-7]
MTVKENLRVVNEKIEAACRRSGRRPEEITVLAVTKYVRPETAQEAVDSGILNLAENRREGLLAKQEAIRDDRVIWHLIGPLQSRKVKDVVGRIDYFHALDRLKIAREINKRMTEGKLKCFVELNLSGEESKHGLREDELDPFIDELRALEHIQVVGLMTMAPYTEDTALIRKVFRNLRLCRDRIRDRHLDDAPCTELSMGMSHDFPIAVEEGATFIRIGTALVGNELKGS